MKPRRAEVMAWIICCGTLCVEYVLDRLDIKLADWMVMLLFAIKAVSVVVGMISFCVRVDQ